MTYPQLVSKLFELDHNFVLAVKENYSLDTSYIRGHIPFTFHYGQLVEVAVSSLPITHPYNNVLGSYVFAGKIKGFSIDYDGSLKPIFFENPSKFYPLDVVKSIKLIKDNPSGSTDMCIADCDCVGCFFSKVCKLYKNLSQNG